MNTTNSLDMQLKRPELFYVLYKIAEDAMAKGLLKNNDSIYI